MIKKICQNCKKEFQVKPYRDKIAKFCSWECLKNFNNWTGKVKKICISCKKSFYVKPYRKNTQRFCSPKCWTQSKESKKIVSGTQIKRHLLNPAIKERCPAWKGGRTPLRFLIKDGVKYKTWREKVFERDNYICQECFTRGGKLNPHHKNPFAIIFSEFLQQYSQFSPIEDKETLVRLAITYEPFWNVDNGITLCEKCHFKNKLICRTSNGCFSVIT